MSDPTVHILKEGRSYCGMSGVPGSWPDDHLWISYQDQENAKEANCPGCLARRDAGPNLAEHLNDLNAEVYPSPDGANRDGTMKLKWVCPLPPGISLDVSGFDAIEDSTGQSAHFDPNIGRWSKIG